MKKQIGDIQQGDVLLKRIDKLPQGVKKKALDKGQIVLAYGEVTGHAHRIKDVANAEFYEKDGKVYLKALKPVSLNHEEHHTVTPIGTYEVRQVREHDYLQDLTRKVID